MPRDDDPLTHRLNAALDALDAAMTEVDDLQRKLDLVTSRMDTLLYRKVRVPSSNLSSNLRSLDARGEVLRKALGRARRASAGALRTYHEASAAYRDHQQRDGTRSTLLGSELANAERCKAALQRVIERQLVQQAERLAPQPEQTPGQMLDGHDGAYRYIPTPIARFFDLVIALEQQIALDPEYHHPTQRHRPVSFLDVGCGTGRNLALLRDSGLIALRGIAGFDIDDAQIARGRAIFGFGEEITRGDALEFDYGNHDVVFSFRPFQDPDLMARYETRLVTTMSRGAYLVAVWPLDLARFPELDCVSAAQDIWKRTA